ncbi:MAG: GNAT family N-acetyltransferase [Pseudonocardia sp.]
MDKFPVDSATVAHRDAGEWGVQVAARGQYAEIRRLLRAAYGPYRAIVDAEVFAVYLADVLDIGEDGGTVLVARDAATVLGSARVFPLRPDGTAYVRGVAVRPDREGEGIAAALMTACAERARAAGASSIHLHTTPFMSRAVSLYERLGYQRDPQRDTDSRAHYGLTVEPRLRALAFRLELARTRRPTSRR